MTEKKQQLVLVYNPEPSGSVLHLRDRRTVTWSADEPVRALPPRDADDAIRFGGMVRAEPLAVVASRLGLSLDQVRAVEPRIVTYTPRGGGEPQEVLVLDGGTRWRLKAAFNAAIEAAAPRTT